MGLSEVADFARNFAVMVKVQGPDPKGLKMRNHAFHHYNSGITTLSASGMLLPGCCRSSTTSSGGTMKNLETVLVLTVASVIEPFILQQYRGRSKIKEKPHLVPGVQIDILLEDKSIIEESHEVSPWVSTELLRLVDVPESSAAVQSIIDTSCSSLENGWEVGWSLASHSRGSQHMIDNSRAQVEQSSFEGRWPMPGVESLSPTLMGKSTSRIALLAVTSKCSMDSLKLQTCVPKPGDFVLAMGSPFGILSPLHFFNNISVGSIGNSYPPNSSTPSLLMADLRCLPGMEGSPVFSENAQFVGLLTRPLRQKISGTEIQLVIPWAAIASACSDLLQEEPHTTSKEINYSDVTLNIVGNMLLQNPTDKFSNPLPKTINPGSHMPSPVQKAMASICLITTEDGSWASGVLLNKQGLVLTNAHLLEPWRFGKTALDIGRNETKLEVETLKSERSAQKMLPKNRKAADIYSTMSRQSSGKIGHTNIRVRLDFTDPWIWTGASIIYISKGPLDIALLQLEVVPDQLCPIVVDFTHPSPGSKAYVIGHGLFGPRCDLLPSACLGVIAKVIEAKKSPQLRTNKFNEQFPAMLQTTAAVHPGSSGGSVLNSDGCMMGLVTSNAKHGGGTVIPHLNFSIPSAALQPIFNFSKDMHDFTILEEIDKPNEHLSSVWALMPPLYPKSEPLLPKVPPQFPSEDKSKETKGSRFAKFMADRKELLQKTAQRGTARSLTDELIQSKL